MTTERDPFALSRTALCGATALAAATLLAACGGGSDPAGPSVSSASATGMNGSAIMYGKPLLITVNGSGLDSGLAVTSPGCKSGPVLSTTAPLASTASTAYYLCTVSALDANEVKVARSSDGALLTTATYTVPLPQVTMTVKSATPGVDGLMVVTLAPDRAPLTVDNFLSYVHSGFYDGTLFHRVVAGALIQGGGYVASSTAGAAPVLKLPLYPPIALEVGKGLSNTQWTLAMARDATPDTATSQFFINVVDNSAKLDPGGSAGGGLGFAVFGTLSPGDAVAAAILGAPCFPLAGFSDPEACLPDPNVVIAAAVQSR